MSEKKHLISAQRLLEGDTVYFTGSGWSTRFTDAALHDKAGIRQALEAAEADVKANLVVGPEVVDVMIDNGVLRPVRTREAVRAIGPTVRTEQGAAKLYEPTQEQWQTGADAPADEQPAG